MRIKYLALTSTALASPALARDGSWYIGNEHGVFMTDCGHIEDLFATGGPTGYDFGSFRLEKTTRLPGLGGNDSPAEYVVYHIDPSSPALWFGEAARNHWQSLRHVARLL